MRFPRRLLLATPLLIAAGKPDAKPASRPVRQGSAIRLRPRGPSVPYHLVPQMMASRLTFTGFPETFILPGEAAVIGSYAIAGREILALGFDASALAGVTQKLTALVGWDGKSLRILDIETMSFSSSDNGSQSSFMAHLVAGPGHDQLRLSIDASRARRGEPRRHEAWTDVLQWQEGAPLNALPPKTPGGPWQTRLAGVRSRVIALLTPPRTELSLDMLDPTGLLDPLGSSPQ